MIPPWLFAVAALALRRRRPARGHRRRFPRLWEIGGGRARQERDEAHAALDELAEMYDRRIGDRLRAELARVDLIGDDTLTMLCGDEERGR